MSSPFVSVPVDRGRSRIRYLIVHVGPYVDNADCCAVSLCERVGEWRERVSLEYLCAGFISHLMRIYVKLKSQIICPMEYLFTKGYGIIYFLLISNLKPCAQGRAIYGGKRHNDGLARFEPRSLAGGTYYNPLRHRRYLTAVENVMQYISYIAYI